jgi:hypothetical protein
MSPFLCKLELYSQSGLWKYATGNRRRRQASCCLHTIHIDRRTHANVYSLSSVLITLLGKRRGGENELTPSMQIRNQGVSSTARGPPRTCFECVIIMRVPHMIY